MSRDVYPPIIFREIIPPCLSIFELGFALMKSDSPEFKNIAELKISKKYLSKIEAYYQQHKLISKRFNCVMFMKKEE